MDKIDPFNRAAPEVLAIRLAIYHGLKKWELMQEIAKRLAEFQPDEIQWTILLAYATRRADQDLLICRRLEPLRLLFLWRIVG